MPTRILTSTLFGIEGRMVEVEVDLQPGLPAFEVVGLPDTAVRESRNRVRAAIKNAGFSFPLCRITVNLAPASLRKEGTGFDLPIALGILAGNGAIRAESLKKLFCLGELSLDGKVKEIPGLLPMVLAAGEIQGLRVIVPRGNLAETHVPRGVRLYGVSSLLECAEILNKDLPSGVGRLRLIKSDPAAEKEGDLGEVRGHALPKRALLVAVAGGHNLLMAGPPGSGKTMLARCLPGILPPLLPEESLMVTRIYSAAGLLNSGQGLVTRRPFRAPHHSVSMIGLIGGGVPLRPGEVTLAHHGVLFLDEVTEFSREALEALRQPMEEGQVTIIRPQGRYVFPAKALMVLAMNPCPCGFYGDPARECRCRDDGIRRYRRRLSGPLLDRIDLRIWVARPEAGVFLGPPDGPSSREIRERVVQAREMQYRRWGKGRTNASLSLREVQERSHLTTGARGLLTFASERFNFSPRRCLRVLRVSRTIADLAEAEEIREEHLAEAVEYQRLELFEN